MLPERIIARTLAPRLLEPATSERAATAVLDALRERGYRLIQAPQHDVFDLPTRHVRRITGVVDGQKTSEQHALLGRVPAWLADAVDRRLERGYIEAVADCLGVRL